MKKRKRVYTNPTGRLWSPVNSLCTRPWPQADIVWRASRCVQVSPCARELDHAKLVRHGVKRALATDVLLRNEPGWYELYSSEGVDLRMIGYILNEVWSFAPAFVLCFRACVRACLRKKTGSILYARSACSTYFMTIIWCIIRSTKHMLNDAAKRFVPLKSNSSVIEHFYFVSKPVTFEFKSFLFFLGVLASNIDTVANNFVS